MAGRVIGYREQAADFAAIRKALKRLDHYDDLQRKIALAAEAALDRIEQAIAATIAARDAAPTKAD